MDNFPFLRFLLLFLTIFLLGTLLCLYLYKWNTKKFFRSTLWLKIVFWIPLTVVFFIVLFGGWTASIIFTLAILLFALYESLPKRPLTKFTKSYVALFIVSTLSFSLVWRLEPPISIELLLFAVLFCSIISDVCAYFFGTLAGRHPLPSWINNRKSWEGLSGQLIGAYIGYLLIIGILSLNIPLWLPLIVGLFSAVGDVFNSVAKRSQSIKNWGNSIPGHGGFLDRFASMSFAMGATTIISVLLT